MKTYFEKFFELYIYNSYYSNQKCSDFAIEPTTECYKLLKNFKLLFKNKENLSSILFEAEDENKTPILNIDDDARFTFQMKLINPRFLNFTDLGQPAKASSIFYFCNHEDESELKLEEVSLLPTIFNYDFQSGSKPVTVKLKNSDGEIVSQKSYNAASDALFHQFNLPGIAPGIYTIEEKSTAESFTEKVYIDAKLFGKELFGLIEIINHKDFPLSYSTSKSFVINFTARSEVWKYYLVISSGNEDYEYTVQDNGYTDDEREEIKFSQAESGEDDQIKTMLGSDGKEIILFESGEKTNGDISEQKIFFSEKPRQKIQLLRKKNSGSGSTKVIIPNLPNPSIKKSKAEVFVNL